MIPTTILSTYGNVRHAKKAAAFLQVSRHNNGLNTDAVHRVAKETYDNETESVKEVTRKVQTIMEEDQNKSKKSAETIHAE